MGRPKKKGGRVTDKKSPFALNLTQWRRLQQGGWPAYSPRQLQAVADYLEEL